MDWTLMTKSKYPFLSYFTSKAKFKRDSFNLIKNLYRCYLKHQTVYFLIFLLFSMYLLDGNVMKVSKFSRTAFFYFGKLLKRQFLGKQILWTCFPVFHSFLRFLLNLSLIEISNRKHTKHKSW